MAKGMPRRAPGSAFAERLVSFGKVGRRVLVVLVQVGVDVLQQDAAREVVAEAANLALVHDGNLIGDVLGALALLGGVALDALGAGGQESAKGAVSQQFVHFVGGDHNGWFLVSSTVPTFLLYLKNISLSMFNRGGKMKGMKKIQVITLFPEMFDGVFNTSMMWKAQKENAAQFSCINLRDFGLGPRKQVDDTPYGGGDGMLLKPEPLFAAVEAAKQADPTAKVVLMTPRGSRWVQATAQAWADDDQGLIFICGRYEGYDERIVSLVDEQVSVGDYVLTGGELPAMTIIDSVVRLIPGVLGGETSAVIESFSDGETLEFPQYTRPEEFRGMRVPDVLLSGHHGEIAKWREANSFKAE